MTKKKPLGILIAIGNQKGGVGKTTVTVNLAAALGVGGYRCLVIDLDPAAGATKHLGVSVNSFAGSLELLSTDEAVDALVITERMPKGVHLVPSRPQLSELDSQLSRYVDRTRILERGIAEARAQFLGRGGRVFDGVVQQRGGQHLGIAHAALAREHLRERDRGVDVGRGLGGLAPRVAVLVRGEGRRAREQRELLLRPGFHSTSDEKSFPQ